tara:strand:+ start:68 stop:229 length:162 start_codon:yes stop_codon:yes gene_type:complete
MNLHYELIITDLDMPDDNVIVHEATADIELVKEAITGHEWQYDEMISGRNNDE